MLCLLLLVSPILQVQQAGRQHTVIIAGLRLEGAEGVDLRHAAPGVVGVTGTVLNRLLGQARVQIHHFSW